MLAKVDIRSVYRIVPVHPEDRLLLGMMWEQALYVDTALPFGLRSAPKIFTGSTTLLACWSLSARDWSSWRPQDFLDNHFPTSTFNSSSLSSGSRTTISSVSISIPRNTSLVASFSAATGTPNSLKVASMIVRCLCTLCRHNHEKVIQVVKQAGYTPKSYVA